MIAALLLGGAVSTWVITNNVGDPDASWHFLYCCLLALVPPYYGFAHNLARPILKGIAVAVLWAGVVGAWLVYWDLMPPRDIVIDVGVYHQRPAVPEYWLPVCLLGAAATLLTGHWLWTVIRRLFALTRPGPGAMTEKHPDQQ